MNRKKTGVILNCLHCNKEFYVFPSVMKRGTVKCCSHSCSMSYRNLINPIKHSEETKKKISQNHARLSGENNPMYGKRGKNAPAYKHGLSGLAKQGLEKHRQYHVILAELNILKKCYFCKITEKLEVHHKDGNHKNNEISNLTWVCKKCHLTKAHTYERNEKGQFIRAKLNPM
jgi:hypothetical protein